MPTRPIRRPPPAPRRRGRAALVARSVAAVVSALVFVATGVVWSQYTNLSDGLHRSAAIAAGTGASAGGDTN